MELPVSIRQLLTSARTAEALKQLTSWTENQHPTWQQGAQLLQAAWANNEQHATRGLIGYEEAERVRNRITAGTLGLLAEIESGATSPTPVLARLQKEFLNDQVAAILQTGNVADFRGSHINVQSGQDVLLGSGNTINKKTIAGLGRWQFWGLIIGLSVLLAGVYYAFGFLSGGQELAYVSLREIQQELKLRGNLDASLRERLQANETDIAQWLTEGMGALKNQDYATAVQYLEKVAEQAPLATVHQNLAYAYEQLGNTAKAQENMAQARVINPNLTTGKSYEQLRGKRINLIAPDNGGVILVSAGVQMERLVDGKDNQDIFTNNDFAVWGFKDKHSATFDQFNYLIPGKWGSQFLTFELSYGNTAPTGPFTRIGQFKAISALVTETPFQEFKFKPVTAKYFRLELQEQSPNGYAYEVQLMGELE